MHQGSELEQRGIPPFMLSGGLVRAGGRVDPASFVLSGLSWWGLWLLARVCVACDRGLLCVVFADNVRVTWNYLDGRLANG